MKGEGEDGDNRQAGFKASAKGAEGLATEALALMLLIQSEVRERE
jgi:hypothetical protein